MTPESEDGLVNIRRQDRIILNCGGVRHETFRTTLRNYPDTRLAWSVENLANNPDFDPDKNEFFFDRHPGVFAQILNFYRTGKLHAPHDVCGPLFEKELTYWGIDEKQMEPCCWSFYTQHREAQESLKVFEGVDMSDSESDEDYDSRGRMQGIDQLSKWQKYKPKIWSMFENHRASRMAKVLFGLSLSFIIISVIVYVLQTLPEIKVDKNALLFLTILEAICGIWFTLEFLIRLATCPSKRHFFADPMNWVDFVAILPVFVRIIGNYEEYPYDDPSSLQYEILAACRLFRLFRFFRLNLGFQIFKQTMIASSRELLLLTLLVLIPVVIFASIAYICERKQQPKKFNSIPKGFWWAIISITTVGYGDLVPETIGGRIFGSLCAATSIIITALPISIIGNNFSLYYSHAQAKMKLPKKEKRAMIGMNNFLVNQSARRSDEISIDNEAEELDTETKLHSGMNGLNSDESKIISNNRRARRARSSLYAGGMVPRMSLPVRSRSSEDFTEDKESPPEDRKKSFTSTQTTTIDTPPKSPPHYGNTLTVFHSDISENILDMSCPVYEPNSIIHNESDEFGLDDIDRAMAAVEERDKKDKPNGLARPGTPVKRPIKHSVRFVKPTLTVTMDTKLGNVNESFVEELGEEEIQDGKEQSTENRAQSRWSPEVMLKRQHEKESSQQTRYHRGRR